MRDEKAKCARTSNCALLVLVKLALDEAKHQAGLAHGGFACGMDCGGSKVMGVA